MNAAEYVDDYYGDHADNDEIHNVGDDTADVAGYDDDCDGDDDTDDDIISMVFMLINVTLMMI